MAQTLAGIGLPFVLDLWQLSNGVITCMNYLKGQVLGDHNRFRHGLRNQRYQLI